jgi:uncharacterized protein (TIGR02246 family)
MREIANELIADYASAWNTHDIDALTVLFHEDGTFVNVVGSYEKDREEIRQLHAVIHASFYKDSVQRAGLWKFIAAHNTRIVPRT